MVLILILLAGLVIVIGGIVFLRLPAFVALTLAALLVASLTPQAARFNAFLQEESGEITAGDGENATVSSDRSWKSETLYVAPSIVDSQENGAGREPQITDGRFGIAFKASALVNGDRITAIVPESFDTVRLGDIVVTREAVESAFQQTMLPALTRVTNALGHYFGRLAILIVCASIIGRCLLDSGAADRIVRSLLRALGESLAPAALTVSSFVLGIPVFFDTVFYLMIPIAKSLRISTGGNYLLYVLAIVAGASMAHSLVPPTPGPLTVAELLDVELAHMILGGIVVGSVAATVGILWATLLNRRYNLELPREDTSAEQEATERQESELPGLVPSLMPIVLPVLLISLPAIISTRIQIIEILSDKNVALLLSAGLALLVYVSNIRPTRQQISDALGSALSSAGTVLLITCAGGAFGKVLHQTNVASLLQELPETSPVLLVVTAFLVTAAIRTAQGSGTVSMITSAGIFGPLVTGGAAGVAPLYIALAIGCGSKPIAWMNDSGFWIITRLSGMTETEGLKYVSTMMIIMGLAGLSVVIAGVLLLPL